MKWLLIFGILVFPTSGSAYICKKWSAPTKVGQLDTSLISEASGIAVSRNFPGRLYHHNDSGSGSFFYLTDASGGQTQKVEFSAKAPFDLEDMSIGPCAEGSCLYLADMGDNFRIRKSLSLWIVPEAAAFAEKADGRLVLFRYPDKAHDAEAMAIHPESGDLYILTKEYERGGKLGLPAQLFRLSAFALRGYVSGQVLNLESVSTIDIPWLSSGFKPAGMRVTSMDIRPDGKALLVLTYDSVLEVDFEKAVSGESRSWKRGEDYSIQRHEGLLSQLEAISYAADGQSYLMDSEFNASKGDKEAPILQASCLSK
jgi:hypothetical protein